MVAFSTKLILIATAVLFVAVSSQLSVADDKLSDRIKEVIQAENPIALNRAYRALLHGANRESLDLLKSGSHDGVAIQAAFEDVKLTASKASSVEENSAGKPLKQEAVERFIGFIEGRLHVPVPAWWEESLSKSKATKDDFFGLSLGMSLTKRSSYYQLKWSDKQGRSLSAPSNVSIDGIVNDRIHLVIGDQQLFVPVPSFQPRGVSALRLAGGDWLIAIHSDVPHGQLMRISEKAEKQKWSTNTWGEFPRYIRDGAISGHWVTIVTNEKQAFVFGATDDVLYLEGFELDDGKPSFRFSSTYPFLGEEAKP
jgi:hypothetical protein